MVKKAANPHERETHMTAIAILDAVLAVFVVAAVLSLLGWGIVTDRAWPASRPLRGRVGRHRVARPGALGLALGRVAPPRGRR